VRQFSVQKVRCQGHPTSTTSSDGVLSSGGVAHCTLVGEYAWTAAYVSAQGVATSKLKACMS